MIPIRNIYYLLCYSWNRLAEGGLVDIDALPRQDLPNLLAQILVNGVNRLLRQGIDRTYQDRAEDSQNPRGKFDLSSSLKRGLLARDTLACVVSELDRDVLHNRILKATIHRLALSNDVDQRLRHELRILEKHLDEVSLISLRAEHFARVQLHRNNKIYRFLLNVSELCFFSLLADENSGEYRFRDFVRDEDRMRKVFQEFIFNFFRIEQHEFKVFSERLHWDTSYTDPAAALLLPDMITDVCLESPTRKIVIECKFSGNSLQENWGKLTARSEHLYQLFAYLKHLERRGGVNERCEGLLLYPTTKHNIDFVFDTQGHRVRVVTLDLRAEWSEIKTRLFTLLESLKEPALSAA